MKRIPAEEKDSSRGKMRGRHGEKRTICQPRERPGSQPPSRRSSPAVGSEGWREDAWQVQGFSRIGKWPLMMHNTVE